jgi:hypothetical protein
MWIVAHNGQCDWLFETASSWLAVASSCFARMSLHMFPRKEDLGTCHLCSWGPLTDLGIGTNVRFARDKLLLQ